MNTTINGHENRIEKLAIETTFTGDKTRELVELLRKEVSDAVRSAAWYLDRQERNLDVFYAWWEGQSLDGRKHQEDQGKEPFPWEDASDTRVRLAEDIVNDDCRVMQAAVRGWQMRSDRTEEQDEKLAAASLQLLRWQLRRKMKGELQRETALARKWRQVHGASVTRITWLETVRLERKTITVEEAVLYLAQKRLEQTAAAAGAQASPLATAGDSAAGAEMQAVDVVLAESEARDLLFNEGRAQELQAMLEGWIPGVAKREWRRAAREWRAGAPAVEIRAPYVHESRPCWRALRVFDDVFFPPDVADLQDAPWIAVREWLSEAAVRDRALREDWPEEFETKLLEHPGASGIESVWDAGAQSRFKRADAAERITEDVRDRFEVITLYRKAVDEEKLVGIFCTVWSALVPEQVGKEDELMDYAHGLYPFIAHRREVNERALLESRGVPEIVMTWQSEVKTQRDARTDRASMDTLPPVSAPTATAKQKLIFGPKAINYTRDPGAIKFMQMTGTVQSSMEVEERTMAEVNWFFGRIADNVPPSRRQLYLQGMIDDYLAEMEQGLVMTWQLCQQYVPLEEVMRLVNDEALAQAVKNQTAAESRELFDVELRFNAENVDMELLGLKMKAINEVVLPADVAGVVERAKMTRWMMYAIDASLAEEVVRPMAAVTQGEVDDEQNQLAKIWSGQEPPYRESGQNAELRLETIQRTVQRNPQWTQRLATDPIFKQLLEARVQHFQHILQQRENAQIGRIGVAPVLGGGGGVTGAGAVA